MAVLLEFYMPLKFLRQKMNLQGLCKTIIVSSIGKQKSLNYIFWFSRFEHTPLALAKLEFGYFVNSFLFFSFYTYH